VNAARRTCLWLVERALPADLAEELAGDLAEEQARHGLPWLVRQGALAVAHVHGARLRERRAHVVLASGAAAAAAVLAGALTGWRLVLHLVPRRAGHPPDLGWLAAAGLLAALAAAWATRAASPPPPRRPRP